MQGLEAHGRISPTGFYGEKLWCPGLRRRESVELWNCSASVRAWAMQTTRRWWCRWPCTGRQPFGSAVVRRWWPGLRCVGAKLSKRLFTISGETVNTCSVLHVREMPAPHAQRLPRLATFSRGRC